MGNFLVTELFERAKDESIDESEREITSVKAKQVDICYHSNPLQNKNMIYNDINRLLYHACMSSSLHLSLVLLTK